MPDKCENCENLQKEKEELEAMVAKMADGMNEASKGVKVLNHRIQQLESANFILTNRLKEVVTPTGRA